jgi:thymidylate kinase
LPYTKGKSFLAVEGARCSGKDTLISAVKERLPEFRYYEYFSPRKDYVDERGSLQVPANLEIQQSSFWVLDFLRQHPDLKVIANRCFLSSLFWDGYQKERFEVWHRMMRAVKGLVIMVEPTFDEHRRRLVKAHRSHELHPVIRERTTINGFAHDLPTELVVWFQEG